MEIDDDAALHIQEVRQHTVIQFRSQDLNEADGTHLLAHAEVLSGAELKGAGGDKVLGGQPGGGQPVPGEPERLLFVHTENIVHDAQTLMAVQGERRHAQTLEVVEKVGFDTLQTGLCGPEVVCIDAEGQVLGLDQTVIAAGKLILQHFGVLSTDMVKFIALGRDGDTPCEALLGRRQVHKGKLELDGGIKVVQEIAPRFKDGGLVLVLRKLVVDVLILDGFGVVVIAHTADAVGPHTLIRDAVLSRFFFLIRPVRSCDGGFDLLSFGPGQLLFGGQWNTPPGLTGSDATQRHRSCWSCTGAASV